MSGITIETNDGTEWEVTNFKPFVEGPYYQGFSYIRIKRWGGNRRKLICWNCRLRMPRYADICNRCGKWPKQ